MGMPVKLSDRLVRAARVEAKVLDRSITAQIEHWAKVGRAVEVALGHVDVYALKASAGDLRRTIPEAPRRRALLAALDKITVDADRATVIEKIRANGHPVYGTDPAFPGFIVRVDSDGTRTPGLIENRQFVAQQTDGESRRR